VQTEIKKPTKVIERLIRLTLLAGIVYFGFIFPDSTSDHMKMIHFSAHVGMSFLLASFIYVFCNIRLRINKKNSIIILMAVTLIIGVVYKYLEISGEGLLHAYKLGTLLEVTGCYTSMSQNMAGILAAILLIEYASAYLKIKIRERVSY
jgi:hypothetical protein